MNTADAIEAMRDVFDRVERKLDRVLTLLEHRPASPLRPADRACLTQLLPACAGVFGSMAFTARDVTCESSLRRVVAGRSPRRIGKLLARGVGTPIDGLIIERAGVELGVVLWSVRAVLVDAKPVSV